MADEDAEWKASVERANKSLPFTFLPAAKLLEGIRQTQQNQATTGRVSKSSQATPSPVKTKSPKKGEKLISGFEGAGSTTSRKRFWNMVADAISASRKLPGQNVKVYEDPTGSVISVPDSRKRDQGGGVGCPSDSDSLNVLFDGIINNGCVSFPSFGSFRVNGDPNGSYILTNDAPGHWVVEIPGVFTLDRYSSDVDCTGFIRTDDESLFIAVTCHADSGIEVSSWIGPDFSSPFCSVFLVSDPDPSTRFFTNPVFLDGFFGSGTATIT